MPGDRPQLRRVYHPSINGTQRFSSNLNYLDTYFVPLIIGTPCDKDGKSNTAGPPRPPQESDKGPDDWSPFNSREAFELADLLYTRNEMPAKQIDDLLDIFAATSVTSGGTPPFTNYKEMYDTIDTIPLGSAPWKHFDLHYQGEVTDDSPSWMTEHHTVWFRDPKTIIHNILANPDFKDEIDYAPFQEHEGTNHRFENLMSGNWAWKQAVTSFPQTSVAKLIS